MGLDITDLFNLWEGLFFQKTESFFSLLRSTPSLRRFLIIKKLKMMKTSITV